MWEAKFELVQHFHRDLWYTFVCTCVCMCVALFVVCVLVYLCVCGECV